MHWKDKHIIFKKKLKMKYSKKLCAHNKVIVTLNNDKDKYLNYETTTSGDTFGNICIQRLANERLKYF